MNTRDCRCHDPLVWGHRSDCYRGKRFIEYLPADASPSHREARACLADQAQAEMDRPLVL